MAPECMQVRWCRAPCSGFNFSYLRFAFVLPKGHCFYAGKYMGRHAVAIKTITVPTNLNREDPLVMCAKKEVSAESLTAVVWVHSVPAPDLLSHTPQLQGCICVYSAIHCFSPLLPDT